MACVACGTIEPGELCARCSGSMRRASVRVLPSGLRVHSAFHHQGAARRLVHRLKYQGIEAAGHLLAREMASGLGDVAALMPVPRVWLRRLWYGVDQSERLAVALSSLTGLTVLHGLSAPVWSPRRAGRNRRNTIGTVLRGREIPSLPCALVDDVVTTGATLMAAASVLPIPPRVAVTATAAPDRTRGLGSNEMTRDVRLAVRVSPIRQSGRP